MKHLSSPPTAELNGASALNCGGFVCYRGLGLLLAAWSATAAAMGIRRRQKAFFFFSCLSFYKVVGITHRIGACFCGVGLGFKGAHLRGSLTSPLGSNQAERISVRAGERGASAAASEDSWECMCVLCCVVGHRPGESDIFFCGKRHRAAECHHLSCCRESVAVRARCAYMRAVVRGLPQRFRGTSLVASRRSWDVLMHAPMPPSNSGSERFRVRLVFSRVWEGSASGNFRRLLLFTALNT